MICRSLGHPADAQEAVSLFREQLDQTYRTVAANFPHNPAVRIESCTGKDRLVLSPLDKLDEPPSLSARRAAIAARPGQAGHQACLDRIAHMRHDDGDRAGGMLRRTTRLRPRRDDDIDLAVDELGRELAEPLVLALDPAVLNSDVLSLNIAVLVQGAAEGCKERPRRISEVSYPGHLARRLRIGEEGRHEDAQGESDDEPDSAERHNSPLTLAPCLP
jgi:hypothetical protein